MSQQSAESLSTRTLTTAGLLVKRSNTEKRNTYNIVLTVRRIMAVATYVPSNRFLALGTLVEIKFPIRTDRAMPNPRQIMLNRRIVWIAMVWTLSGTTPNVPITITRVSQNHHSVTARIPPVPSLIYNTTAFQERASLHTDRNIV